MRKEDNTDQVKKKVEILSVRDILDLMISKWLWFVICIILCLAIAWGYLSTTSPVYRRTAVILVKNENQSSSQGNMTAIFELNGFSTGSNVENEIYILRSYQIMKEVVKRLNLNINYSVKDGFREENLYGKLPFEVVFLDTNSSFIELAIQSIDSEKYNISQLRVGGETLDFSKNANYSDTLQTPIGRLVVIPNPVAGVNSDQQTVNITRNSIENSAYGFMSKITTSLLEKNSTLIKVVCEDTNISRSDDILNMILQIFNETVINDKNRIATNTANFIDERILIISEDLENVESRLTEFKRENRIVDLSSNAALYLNESSKTKEETLQLETQLNVANYIKDYLFNASKTKDLIPNISDVGDGVLQSQIVSYNELVLQRNRIAANSGENNPNVLKINENLNSMQKLIAGSVDNYLKTLQVRLDNVRSQERKSNRLIENIPLQEKYTLDIMRQQSIKEALYTYLLQKREETAMQLAATETNIRVIEYPFGVASPISPVRTRIYMIGFMLGLIIPFLYFFLSFVLNTAVRGRRDVEDLTSIPILGEIPENKHNEDILINTKKDDKLAEAFRILRANFDFMKEDFKVFMFTSTIAGEGKSFISRNFAATLSLSGKNVLLIDSDIRKSTQSSLLGVKVNHVGLSNYLSGQVDLKDIIIKNGLTENVDLIPAGTTPPNPTELLLGERLDIMISDLKNKYDYILLDNVPAQIIADAVIVNRIADVTFYIIKDGLIDRRYLPELERLYQEDKFNRMYVIINGSKTQNRYGYGYGYSYYLEDSKKRHIVSNLSKLKKVFGRK